MCRYIVKWENTRTGFKSQGSPISKNVAIEAARRGNSEYPYIIHRAVPLLLRLVN